MWANVFSAVACYLVHLQACKLIRVALVDPTRFGPDGRTSCVLVAVSWWVLAFLLFPRESDPMSLEISILLETALAISRLRLFYRLAFDPEGTQRAQSEPYKTLRGQADSGFPSAEQGPPEVRMHANARHGDEAAEARNWGLDLLFFFVGFNPVRWISLAAKFVTLPSADTISQCLHANSTLGVQITWSCLTGVYLPILPILLIMWWMITLVTTAFYEVLTLSLEISGVDRTKELPSVLRSMPQAYTVRRYWSHLWYRFAYATCVDYAKLALWPWDHHFRLDGAAYRFLVTFVALSFAALIRCAVYFVHGVTCGYWEAVDWHLFAFAAMALEDLVIWLFGWCGGGRVVWPSVQKFIGYAWVLAFATYALWKDLAMAYLTAHCPLTGATTS